MIAFADGWVALMEAENYEAAFNYMEQIPATNWTPSLLREVVKAYDEADDTQKVTLLGEPTDIRQRKSVERHDPNRHQFIGEIWYDLNIDGRASDLTATFHLKITPDGIVVFLNDIHVM